MKGITGVILCMAVGLIVQAQTLDSKTIVDKLCGCFEVDFRYAETFSPDPGYKFHERDETGATAELALPIEVSERKIVIQHLLIVSPTMVVKHWREEWTYENPVIWRFKGDRVWVKETVPVEKVKGKWTQTIWEVADEPRYQGFGQLINLDGRITWQNTTDAPLPRREYTVRNDYNILRRTNRLSITDTGYVHEQDNHKIIRKNGVDKLLVEEKGFNTYKKINDKECAAAKTYWEANKEYWSRVRSIWTEYIGSRTSIALKNKVDDKFLHEYLISLSKEFASKKIMPDQIDARIRTEINRFLSADEKAVAIND